MFYNEDEELSNFFSKEELEDFLIRAKKDMSLKDYTLFRLLAVTGLRKGEALALHWSDINFDTRSVTVRKTLAHYDGQQVLQLPKNVNSRRVISFNDITLSALKEWQDIQREEYKKLGLLFEVEKQPVFTRFKKSEGSMIYLRLASPNEALAKFFNKHSDLPRITVHGFRHTFASLLHELKFSVRDSQELLGHTDIQTTMNVYTHLSKNMKEKTLEKLNDFIDF